MPNKPLRERQLPRAHKIARCMAALGYEPRPLQDPNFVEYTKDYAEPGGRIGRCSVFFTRESWISDMDSAKLGKFRVTVQGQIDPVAELVNEQAPRRCAATCCTCSKSLKVSTYLAANQKRTWNAPNVE